MSSHGYSLPCLLMTANVGSVFEDPENKLKVWLSKVLMTIDKFKPSFIAIHFQEIGGKIAQDAGAEVEVFVSSLLESTLLEKYDRISGFFDQDFETVEKYTAMGSCYFIHSSLEDVSMWNFKEERFCFIGEREIHRETYENPFFQKLKFPKNLFPREKYSRKGYIRTRWKINNCVLDMLNIHLFHDASNIVAYQTTPSPYSSYRRNALKYTLERLKEDHLPTVPAFLFGDFNFRMETKEAVDQGLCKNCSQQFVRKDGENGPCKVIFRDANNENNVLLTLESRKFILENQTPLQKDNALLFRDCDKEMEYFKDQLCEFPPNFPPSYPFSENIKEPTLYSDTRLPAWCDRVLFSHSVKPLISSQPRNKEDSVRYNMIGQDVCMGDHKPIYLSFWLDSSIHTEHMDNSCSSECDGMLFETGV